MRKIAVVVVSLLCLVAAAVPAVADQGNSNQFPSVIDLPAGSFPEGLAVGRGSTFFVGSIADGSIYKGDLRTGEYAPLTEPAGFFTTLGLNVDQRNRVWVAGAVTGTGRVYDGATGDLLATYQFPAGPWTINDVIVTPKAAWFTDSGTTKAGCPPYCGTPRLFKVTLGPDGELPDPGDPASVAEVVVYVDDVAFSNLNGIETMPGGAELIVAHTTAGALYRVDPDTGEATLVYGPPTNDPLVRPDGIVRLGRTIYVVENAAGRIAVIDIDPSSGLGTLIEHLPVPGAQTPATAALFGSAVYTVDARLGDAQSGIFTGPYRIFRIDR